jgi:dolichol-phosphate mannosyltransferase
MLPRQKMSAPPAAATRPLVSVVVPVRNEGPNILPLVGEIRAALATLPHEIVYVDDGSTDDTGARLREAIAGGAPLAMLRHRASCGQSAAIVTGVRAARGEWVATLDGDGQNDPADIPALLARAQAEQTQGGPVLIAGHRVSRKDTQTKRLASRAANRIRAALLNDATPDTGCGLKLFRREDFLQLPHFDHMHRYLPALFIRAGGRVISLPVNHRPRTRGKSNYGTLDRLWVGIFDLAGVYWLQRRWKRPVVELQERANPGVAPAPAGGVPVS